MPPRPERIDEIRYGVNVTIAPKYTLHQPKDQSKSPCLLVQYAVAYFERDKRKFPIYANKFVAFETTGKAREFAEEWWANNVGDGECPKTAQEAIDRVTDIKRPEFVVFKIGNGLFHQVVEERFPATSE